MKKKDIVGALAGKSVSLVGLLVLPAIASRVLDDQAAFGVYMLVAGMVALVAQFSQMGMNTVLLARIGENRQKTIDSARLIRTTQRRLFMLSVLVSVTGTVWLGRVCHSSGWSLGMTEMAAVLLICMLAAQQFLLGDILRGYGKNTDANFHGEACAIVIIMVLLSGCLLAGGKTRLMDVLLVHLAGYGFATVVGQWRLGSVLRQHQESAVARDQGAIGYLEGFALSFAAVGMLLVNQIGLSLAGWMLGVAAAGVLAVAHRISMLVLLPNMFLNGIIAGRIVELKVAAIQAQTKYFLRKCWMVLTASSAIIALPLCVWGGWIVENLFGGAAVEQTASVIMILAGGRMIAVMCGVSGLVLALHGRYREILIGASVAMVLSCIMMGLLGINMGLEGIAIGLCVASVWQNASQLRHARKLLGFWPVGIKS